MIVYKTEKLLTKKNCYLAFQVVPISMSVKVSFLLDFYLLFWLLAGYGWLWLAIGDSWVALAGSR